MARVLISLCVCLCLALVSSALVGTKSAAAQADARELWSSATPATRASTHALLNQAVSSEAKTSAADALRGIQQAEDELLQISQLLETATGGRAAAVGQPDLIDPPSVVASGSRHDLARQAAADLAQAEELLAQLASDLQSRTRRRGTG